MCNRLRESDLLTHAFAVACNLSSCSVSKPDTFKSFCRQAHGIHLVHAMQHEAIEDKLPPIEPARTEVELRAIADVSKEFRYVAGRQSQDRNVSARGLNQTCHEIHEGCLAGAIRANQRCDPRRDRERDTVHAENFTVKLGYIFEDDPVMHVGHPRTTSLARMRVFSIARQSRQARMYTATIAAVGSEEALRI